MTKTEFMLIDSRQRLNTLSRLPHLTLGDVSVDQVTAAKSIGIYIDENLSSNTQAIHKLNGQAVPKLNRQAVHK